MKKFKLLIYVIGIMLSISFLCTELFYWTQSDGNVILYVQNQTKNNDSTDVKIYLDKKTILDKRIESHQLIPPCPLALNETIGIHELSVHNKENLMKGNIKIGVFLVTWIIVDIYSDSIIIKKQYTPPVFQ